MNSIMHSTHQAHKAFSNGDMSEALDYINRTIAAHQRGAADDFGYALMFMQAMLPALKQLENL